jgi:hypothetical protein
MPFGVTRETVAPCRPWASRARDNAPVAPALSLGAVGHADVEIDQG